MTQITLWDDPVKVRRTGPRWVNVRGHVSGDVLQLRSRLNAGQWCTHWTGPDLRRLMGQGDFNIELQRADLQADRNRLEIETVGIDERTDRAEVWLDRIDKAWTLPHSVYWENPESYEITDGAWAAAPDGLRCTAPGYDRIVTFGDDTWGRYDLTTHVTFHDAAEPLARAPTFGVSHIALAAHWPGHGNDMHDPHLAWYPLGATCEWQVNPRLTGCRFRMLFGAGQMVEEAGQGRDLAFDQPYALRLRIESDGATSKYSIRAWQADQSEPSAWALQATKTYEDMPRGAAALLAHNTDVTFGRTEVTPI